MKFPIVYWSFLVPFNRCTHLRQITASNKWTGIQVLFFSAVTEDVTNTELLKFLTLSLTFSKNSGFLFYSFVSQVQTGLSVMKILLDLTLECSWTLLLTVITLKSLHFWWLLLWKNSTRRQVCSLVFVHVQLISLVRTVSLNLHVSLSIRKDQDLNSLLWGKSTVHSATVRPCSAPFSLPLSVLIFKPLYSVKGQRLDWFTAAVLKWIKQWKKVPIKLFSPPRPYSHRRCPDTSCLAL